MSNTTDQWTLFLSMFATQVPTLIVCLVGFLVALSKWKVASTASLWALIGFGIALFLGIALPLGQVLLQQWAFQSGERAARMWVFGAYSVFGSLLHAAIYACLLVAIFSGRSKPSSPNPPPPIQS